MKKFIPIIFKNTWAKSFESVTGIYGPPLADEPDPTPFLAPFFTLFFCLALTDAGYGIVLAVFSLLAIKIMKIPKTILIFLIATLALGACGKKGELEPPEKYKDSAISTAIRLG